MGFEALSLLPVLEATVVNGVWVFIYGLWLCIMFYALSYISLSPLNRSMGLVVSRETQHMGVTYYVDKGFQKEYKGASLLELEKSVENDYMEHLQSSCWKEKQQSRSPILYPFESPLS